MANSHGGYRKPSKPAAVSGPGGHSKRTDGQPIRDIEGGAYGDTQDLNQIQSGAQLAGGSTSAAPQAMPAAPVQMPTPLSAASQQPSTPVTAGAKYGAGPGPDALGMLNLDQLDAQDFAKYRPLLIDIAMRDSTPQSTKQMIRRLLAQ
jgi:hypothetical protein